MRCRYLCVLFIALLLAARPSGAQDAPVEWGDVPRADLEMQTYPADSNATAVILADYAEVRFRRRSLAVKMERHVRIKILSKAGYDHATVEIPFYAEDRLQDVDDIEGQTFALAADGEVVRHELDSDDVFEEDIDGEHNRMRFTLPALEPGAVVEYRYEKTSKNPRFLPDWYFQSDEPTRHSEYRLAVPHMLNYVFLAQGVSGFDVRDQKRVRDEMRYRWVMKDIPALREEPFMTTLEDYRARMEVQLQSVELPNGRVQKFMNSWQEVADDLVGHDYFGEQLGYYGDVREKAEAVVRDLDDPEEQMRALYDFVRENIRYNGKAGLFAGNNLDDVLEARTGSSPEVALLLTSMLRDVGLEAHPVLISTRSHGRVQNSYPMVRQFNDVIVYVEAGGTHHLLDATNELRPAGLLPSGALKRQGLLIRDEDEGGADWVQTGADEAGLVRSVYVNAALSPDGTLDGTLDVTDEAYSALARRHSLKNNDDLKALVRTELLSEDLSEAEVRDVQVENRANTGEALRTNAGLTVPAYAQAAGDFLYVNPTVADRYDGNPLQRPERSFPVDMAYPRNLRYTLVLALPEGYVVHDAPKDTRVRLSEGAYFERLSQAQGGQFVVRSRLSLGQTTFAPEQYDNLRDFFGRFVAAQAEQVVLKRAAPEASMGASGNAAEEATGQAEASGGAASSENAQSDSQ